MDELVDIALRHSGCDPLTATRIPQLEVARSDARSLPIPVVYRPCFCFLVQGAKEVTLGRKVYRYAAHEHLVSTVDLPMTGEIVEASAQRPYLCFVLAIEPASVYEVLRRANQSLADEQRSERPAIFVGKKDPAMTDAVLRLVRCLDEPADCQVLAPGIISEIVYRLLKGRFGAIVREIGIVGSRTERVARAIEELKRSYAQKLRIEQLAGLAGMSASTFHEHFKRVTTLSPLQYQKQLRLYEARRLLLSESESAAEVSFRVGYQSPSQFSREYARFFGRPPRADTRDRPVSGRAARS
jgi:AraC-like DNA-binding protein